MTANVHWTIKHYDKDSNGITAASMEATPTTTNIIKHAFSRKLGFHLNTIDDLEFNLYLHDPMAATIRRLNSHIKVWRKVTDDAGSTLYEDAFDEPCFAGVVSGTTKSGSANMMTVRAFSPLWKLQSRFHILNHYLKTNPLTSNPWTQSELMQKLIDLVDGAFGGASATGISAGTFFWGGEPEMAPYFVQKGSNTWSHIFDTIMVRSGGVDIIPTYYHVDGIDTMMFFNTDEKRGDDISATVKFNYHTGTNDNLDDLEETDIAVPGEFGNYTWAVGQGGPNSGKIAMRQNNSAVAGSDGYGEIGIYMRRADFEDIKAVGVTTPQPTGLQAIVEAEFAHSRVPKTGYTVDISPAGNLYYQNDFTLGDVVELNADKGALSVTEKKQRVYDAVLTLSENNVEKADVTVADDFYGKVAT